MGDAMKNKLQKQNSKDTTRKMVLTAMITCMAFVLSTFVVFPAMAPFQHFANVIAAVILGPFYAFLSAFICGAMRMATGRTIQAIVGGIFGPILGGILYKKTKSFVAVWIGEVIGTGFIGAMAAYPLMKYLYGLDLKSPFYFIPFYIPSALVGGGMGVAVLYGLKKTGTLERVTNYLK